MEPESDEIVQPAFTRAFAERLAQTLRIAQADPEQLVKAPILRELLGVAATAIESSLATEVE